MTKRNRDKWDREVERLKKKSIEEIHKLWYIPNFRTRTRHAGSPLFDKLRDDCGGPVQIKNTLVDTDSSVDYWDAPAEVTKYLKSRKSFPASVVEIQKRHLPMFAKVQRINEICEKSKQKLERSLR